MATSQPIPEITDEMKDVMKSERLTQYKARIYNLQMDIAAYQAVNDSTRLEMSEKNLDDLVISYYAVEAMV